MKNLMRQWDKDTISYIIMAYIVIHNMIFEDEKGLRLDPI